MIETFLATKPRTQAELLAAVATAMSATDSTRGTLKLEGFPSTSELTRRRMGNVAAQFTVMIDSLHDFGGTPFVIANIAGPSNDMVRIEVIKGTVPSTPEDDDNRPVEFTIATDDDLTELARTDVA